MTAADPLAALRARVQELETQLAALDAEVLDLRDALDSAHAAVVAEQRSHQAYRLRNPQKRAACLHSSHRIANRTIQEEQ